MERAARWAPPVWALTLSLLMLGPALGPGFVLTYDMVWVPDLALRSDFLGLGSGLPRAVPSDAVVAVLDELVPGALLQKVVLLGALLAGGLGAVRLAPRTSLAGRLVAVTVYVWNPFVVERLQLGHWPVLLGYGVLPWVIVLARRLHDERRVPAALGPLLVLGSLSAGAGLVTGLVACAFGLRRAGRRTNLVLLVLVVAANAPWLVSGTLHAGTAVTDQAGARMFALNDAGPLPAPLAALGLGGTWNVEVLLPSRDGALALLALGVLLLLAAAGVRSWYRSVPARERGALVGCWAAGWVVAVLTWGAPGLAGWLVETVPGAGLLRDGSRLLALCAPLTAALAAHGADALVSRAGAHVARAALTVAVVLAPVAVMADAAFGLSGRLGAVDYPAAYAQTRNEVEKLDDAGVRGDTLVLPLTSYRAPAWNGGRKVLDPLGRYLPGNYVASDELVVSDRRIRGEDPRVGQAADALAGRSPQRRAEGLAQLGIGLVVHDRTAGDAPVVAGAEVSGHEGIDVVTLTEVRPRETPGAWIVAMALAWTAYLVGLAAPLVARAVPLVPGRRAARPPT